MNTSAGVVVTALQLSSLNVLFGAMTKCSPGWRPVKSLACQTAKQVGYPYQLLLGLVMSPMKFSFSAGLFWWMSLPARAKLSPLFSTPQSLQNSQLVWYQGKRGILTCCLRRK